MQYLAEEGMKEDTYTDVESSFTDQKLDADEEVDIEDLKNFLAGILPNSHHDFPS